MKCSAPLAAGGSCGQQARFEVRTRPYCRRHASEAVFQIVLKDVGQAGDRAVVMLKRLDQ